MTKPSMVLQRSTTTRFFDRGISSLGDGHRQYCGMDIHSKTGCDLNTERLDVATTQSLSLMDPKSLSTIHYYGTSDGNSSTSSLSLNHDEETKLYKMDVIYRRKTEKPPIGFRY